MYHTACIFMTQMQATEASSCNFSPLALASGVYHQWECIDSLTYRLARREGHLSFHHWIRMGLEFFSITQDFNPPNPLPAWIRTLKSWDWNTMLYMCRVVKLCLYDEYENSKGCHGNLRPQLRCCSFTSVRIGRAGSWGSKPMAMDAKKDILHELYSNLVCRRT